MGINVDLEKIKEINFKEKFFWFKNSLANNIRWIILTIALLVFLFAFYIWYTFVFNHSWSEYQEKEYIDVKSKGVELSEQKTEEIISRLEKRRDRFQNDIPQVEDIFRLH